MTYSLSTHCREAEADLWVISRDDAHMVIVKNIATKLFIELREEKSILKACCTMSLRKIFFYYIQNKRCREKLQLVSLFPEEWDTPNFANSSREKCLLFSKKRVLVVRYARRRFPTNSPWILLGRYFVSFNFLYHNYKSQDSKKKRNTRKNQKILIKIREIYRMSFLLDTATY